jgi:ParB family transcriptional regulator, chromosome partitioning protein
MALATIQTHLVETGTRLRSVSEAQVEALRQSISDVGLLNPITVYRRQVIDGGIAVEGFGLVAGAHRLEAVRRLGLAEIDAVIVDLGDLERQIAECDENLCASSLTKSERALFTRRRKEAYEALHPETKQGATGGTNAGKARSEVANFATSVPRFTADTAAKTGQSERAVQLDAERGEKIAPAALEKIKGTRLDTGVYLDKLKKVAPEKQVETVKSDLQAAKPKAKQKKPAEAEKAPEAPEPEPIPDPYGYAKLTEEALLDTANGLRADLDDAKKRIREQTGQIADLKARLKDFTGDKDEAIRRLSKQIEHLNSEMFRANEAARVKTVAARKAQDEVKALRAKLEHQVIDL